VSLRDVELILAARGIVVSYESIRERGLRFGRIFANMLRERRPQPGDKWYMDNAAQRSCSSATYSHGGFGAESRRYSARKI